jgi:acyl-coenzyme A thioesterase PaaI-like protein
LDTRHRPWHDAPPGRLIGRGHPAGDFLEAYDWIVLEERDRYLRLDVRLPERVKNPRGQLFGGFTPTYVDLVALLTVRRSQRERGTWSGWLATTNMRIDYLDPVTGPRFTIDSELVKDRGRLKLVSTRFFDSGATLLVLALTTMREISPEKSLGDG